MRARFHVGGRAFALAALGLAACAQIPLVELEAYGEAYQTARTAADLMLDEIAAIEDVRALAPAAGPGDCPIDPTLGFRKCFDVALALGPRADRPEEVVDLRVRRLALDQIAGYNRLLIDLAQGRSAAALEERIDRLQDGATRLVGLGEAQLAGLGGAASTALIGGLATVQAFVDAVQPVLGRLETMRARNAAADSILAAEPDIRALIGLLKDDAPSLYRLYVNDYNERVGLLEVDVALARGAAERARLEARLAAMTDPDSPENAARAFEKSLIAYLRLLDASEKALVALTRAIRAPAEDPVAAAAAFAQRAAETRVLAEEFLGRIRALRAPAR